MPEGWTHSLSPVPLGINHSKISAEEIETLETRALTHESKQLKEE